MEIIVEMLRPVRRSLQPGFKRNVHPFVSLAIFGRRLVLLADGLDIMQHLLLLFWRERVHFLNNGFSNAHKRLVNVTPDTPEKPAFRAKSAKCSPAVLSPSSAR